MRMLIILLKNAALYKSVGCVAKSIIQLLRQGSLNTGLMLVLSAELFSFGLSQFEEGKTA
jgi:hypothetical protein